MSALSKRFAKIVKAFVYLSHVPILFRSFLRIPKHSSFVAVTGVISSLGFLVLQ